MFLIVLIKEAMLIGMNWQTGLHHLHAYSNRNKLFTEDMITLVSDMIIKIISINAINRSHAQIVL